SHTRDRAAGTDDGRRQGRTLRSAAIDQLDDILRNSRERDGRSSTRGQSQGAEQRDSLHDSSPKFVGARRAGRDEMSTLDPKAGSMKEIRRASFPGATDYFHELCEVSGELIMLLSIMAEVPETCDMFGP